MTARSARISGRRMAVIFYGTAGVWLGVDLLSKWYVFRALDPGRAYTFIPHILNLRLSMNEGAAFSLGRGWWPLFVAFSAVASVVVIWCAHRYGRRSRFLTVALGLLLSGALGNVYDRIFWAGRVRDFLDLHVGGWHYPAIFNVADVAICAGCGMILLYAFRKPEAVGSKGEKGRR